MKPLLILAPSPSRWPAVAELLADEEALWLDDLRRRMTAELSGSRDALALLPDGGRVLAIAALRRREQFGVLGQLFTHPDHRRRGYARQLLQALLSWFDMTGGRWLYLTSPQALAGEVFEKFGFRPLHGPSAGAGGRLTMLRTPAHVPENPFEGLSGRVHIREAGRADWPLIVALLQYHHGPDPRVPLEESAPAAETTALDLIARQERGECRLVAACCQERIIGLGSVATDQSGPRTYAMLMPCDCPHPGLRPALLECARTRGYEQVEFPMDALLPATAPATEADAPTPTPENSTAPTPVDPAQNHSDSAS